MACHSSCTPAQVPAEPQGELLQVCYFWFCLGNWQIIDLEKWVKQFKKKSKWQFYVVNFHIQIISITPSQSGARLSHFVQQTFILAGVGCVGCVGRREGCDILQEHPSSVVQCLGTNPWDFLQVMECLLQAPYCTLLFLFSKSEGAKISSPLLCIPRSSCVDKFCLWVPGRNPFHPEKPSATHSSHCRSLVRVFPFTI